MGLGPQRVGQAADDVELAGDRAQLGVVTQGDDGTYLARPATYAGAELTTSARSPAR